MALLFNTFHEMIRYNYTGTQFFPVQRKISLDRLRHLAKSMIEACLPIKCLEATALAIFITEGQKEFKRFTLSFCSEFEGQCFKHIVLGVHADGKYGALGLSRRDDLMYRPLEYSSLGEFIESYMHAYSGHSHRLLKVKLGLPIPHQPYAFQPVPWKGLTVKLGLPKLTDNLKRTFNQYSRIITGQVDCCFIHSPITQLPALNSNACNSTYHFPLRHRGAGTIRREVKMKSKLALVKTIGSRGIAKRPVKLTTCLLPIKERNLENAAKTSQYQVRV
ncbi:unnamed protein product [Dicrocoelium dendriticum]|nr:unnamed protein product [Dicrocoelium dendriticum]